MPTCLPASAFDQSVKELSGHLVIDEIARSLLGITPDMLNNLVYEDGRPTYRLTALANDRFAERTGGEHGRYIGSAARAVLARLAELRADATTRLLATLPTTVTEALAAELEARQALRDMWHHGFPGCPLTRYAEAAGRLADRLS
ncbi:hypothetical protein AB0O47_32605 [Streptomyces noursei]|uniref:hypothetical protein n=1 Tax=Streptomyces noursei TaxID=1971 RepID=UPI00344DC125